MRFLFFILFFPFVINAQVDLTAQGALEWDAVSQTVKAIKDAKVVHGTTTIFADLIIGHYTENNGKKTFQKLTAKGDVRIESDSEKIETETLTYNLITGTLLLEGKPWTYLYHDQAILSSKEPITFQEKEGTATAKNSSIEHEGRTLFAPHLIAYFGKDDKGLKKVVASGNITLKTEEETLTSKEAIYDAQSGLATLTNNVALIRKDGSSIKGGKLVYDMKKGITRLHANPQTGKVEGSFQ
ncbi:MAG: hypothetical protein JXR30_01415 [Alphaproteobacteria bacterium]|nr:hypothetical protein [Alphaproteobacteria bacterium]